MAKTVPVTFRIDKSALERFKSEARKKAIASGADITYIDLIRDIIYQTAPADSKGIDIVGNIANTDDWNARSFWTPEGIDSFNRSDMGIMCAKAIEENNYSEFIAHFKKVFNEWISQECVATLGLCRTSGRNRLCMIEREIASAARVICRRGAVPDQQSEGEHINVPRFDIACHPSIKRDELTAHLLFDALAKGIVAIQRELDSNFFNLLSPLDGLDRYPKVSWEGVSTLWSAVGRLASNSCPPSRLFMHPLGYMKIRQTGCVHDADPLSVVFNTKRFGTWEGIPITTSIRCDHDTIFMASRPENVGVLYTPCDVEIRHIPESTKLRESFLLVISVGLAIVNDYSVVKISL